MLDKIYEKAGNHELCDFLLFHLHERSERRSPPVERGERVHEVVNQRTVKAQLD